MPQILFDCTLKHHLQDLVMRYGLEEMLDRLYEVARDERNHSDDLTIDGYYHQLLEMLEASYEAAIKLRDRKTLMEHPELLPALTFCIGVQERV